MQYACTYLLYVSAEQLNSIAILFETEEVTLVEGHIAIKKRFNMKKPCNFSLTIATTTSNQNLWAIKEKRNSCLGEDKPQGAGGGRELEKSVLPKEREVI